MEQQRLQAASKSKNKYLNFLPRAASSVTFRIPPLYSPGKEKKSSHISNLGRIGVNMIPSDRKSYEPTSPMVSCMGQVKCKQYQKRLVKQASKITRSMSFNPKRMYNKDMSDQQKVAKLDPRDAKSKKKLARIRSIFGGGGRSNKCDATNDKSKDVPNIPKAPDLSTMKRFSSGREAFGNFDWTTTQVAPSDSVSKNCFRDHEDDGNIKVRVKPVKLEPSKEINLWKRRTVDQPKPLQLHVD